MKSNSEGPDHFISSKPIAEPLEVTYQATLRSLHRRINDVGLPLNAVAGDCFEEASALTNERDFIINQGIFRGLPISIEDSFIQKHFSCSFGLPAKASKIQESDGLIVKVLKNQGAIPLVRSSVSQGGVLLETTSQLWGRCVNPWNSTRATPGTAGGAAALVASGCVPLAVVSDFGGGASLSALNTGLYSIIPTPVRTTIRGLANPIDDTQDSWFINLKPSVGAFSRSVDDLALFLKGFWAEPIDALVPYLPFDEGVYTSTRLVKVGIVHGDFGLELPSVTLRALEAVKTALLCSASAEVASVNLDWLHRIQPIFDNWTSTGGYTSKINTQKPRYGIFSYLWNLFSSQKPSPGNLVQESAETDSYTFFSKHRVALDNLRPDLLQVFQSHDVLVLPSLMSPAWPVLHGSKLQPFRDSLLIGSLYNLPCGTVPVTTVQPAEQDYTLNEAIQANLKGSAGLPVGVLMISRPFHDEAVLNVMKLLQDGLRFEISPKLA